MNATDLLALIWPFDLNGPEFLMLYWLLGIGALVGGLIIRFSYLSKPGVRGDGAEPTPYEVACLAGPPARAVHAAIAQLCQDGLISVDGSSGLVSFVAPGDVSGRPPIEQSVLRAVAGKTDVPLASVEAACAPELADLESSLRARGLLVPPDLAKLAWKIPALLIAAVQLLAVVRFFAGIARGKPVGFLVLSFFGIGFLGILLLGRRAYRTSQGDAVLRGLKTRYQQMQREAIASGAVGSPSPSIASLALPLAVGVLGSSVLAGTPADGMYQRMRATGGDAGGYGGSDSSGDSGSGDGGGGGCGGCGGGGD